MANGYATYAGGQAPVRFSGSKKKNLEAQGRYLTGRQQQVGGRSREIEALLAQYLGSPTGGAEAYLPFFQQAAEGFSAPALRDFRSTVAERAANVASRWGGGPSTTEERTVAQAGDVFSRNLTEALARLAPEAVGAAQRRGGQLIQTRGMYGGEEQDISSMIQEYIKQQKSGSPFARILGTGLGLAGGAFLPGIGNAAGAWAGKKLFGG